MASNTIRKSLHLSALEQADLSERNLNSVLERERVAPSELGTVHARAGVRGDGEKLENKALPVFLLLLGGSFAWYLSAQWSVNPQYYYGWGVPLLSAYLFWKRWEKPPLASASGGAVTAVASGAAALALLLVLRLVQEANPDWRLVNWSQGLAMVVIGCSALWWHGGKKWVAHFAFPLLFVMIALPWPTRIEGTAVSGLTEVVVRSAREALLWMGQPVWKAGKVIYYPGGAAGVEDACSGIRSLQSTLMAVFFLGEVFALSGARRLALFLAGIFLALVTNIGRTIFLTSVAISGGDAGVNNWHGMAGILALATLFGLLFFVAFLFGKRKSMEAEPEHGSCERIFPWWPIGGLAGCLCVIEVTTWFWFPRNDVQTALRVKLPEGNVSREKVDARVRSILCFNNEQAASWIDSSGAKWTLYNFGWKAGGPGAAMAKYHSPEICLPSVGMEQRSLNEITVKTKNGEMPFRLYRFEAFDEPFFVFYTLVASGKAAQRDQNPFATILKELSMSERLARVLRHERPPAVQSLEIIVSGNGSVAEVERGFRNLIPQIVD
jgi:exosortase